MKLPFTRQFAKFMESAWMVTRSKWHQQMLVFSEQVTVFSERRLNARRQWQAAIVLVKARLSTVERLSHTGGWEWDIKKDIWTFSEGWLHIHGCTQETLISEELLMLAHPSDRDFIRKAFEEVRLLGQNYELEYRIIRPDNHEIRWVVGIGELITDKHGNPLKLVGAVQDITERKQAEEALKQSTRLLEETQSIARVGGWERDLFHDTIFWSSETYRILEVSPHEPIPSLAQSLELFLPESRRVYAEAIEAAVEQGTEFDVELETLTAKGRRIYIRSVCKVNRRNGQTVKLVGTMQDITSRKQVENDLRASEQLVTGIVNSIPVRVFWKDRALAYLGCNVAFARDAGCDNPQNIIGKDDTQLGWREQAQSYRADDLEVMASGQPKLDIEEVQTTLDGEEITLLTNKLPLRDSRGEICGVLGTYQDITARKEAELQLRKLSNIIEQAPLSIVITDLWGAIEYTNPRFTKVTGYTAQEALGKNPRLLKSGEMPAELYRDMWATLKRGEVWSGELRNRRKNGETYLETAVISPVLNALGEVTHYVALKEDLTAQKRREADAEAKLAQEHEISEMKSRFISVTSHQFRTPMAAAMGSAEILANHLDRLSPEKRTELFARINSSLTRMTVMLDEILLLNRIDAKRLEVKPAKVDLGVFVKDMIEGIRMGDTADHRFEFNDKSQGDRFITDPNLLNNILENLLSNAVRYSPAGSVITVEMEVDNNELRLSVVDQGMGIPPEDRARIFEPFERASNVGTIKGTGLGLNIVKRMSEMLGGTIALDCPERGGCRFTVILPESFLPASAEV